LKLLFGEEKYATNDDSFARTRYGRVGFEISSRWNSKLQTEWGAAAQRHEDNWYLSGQGSMRWYFHPANSITLSTSLNQLWSDPFVAAFYQGRLYGVTSDLNWLMLNRLQVWSRVSFERHLVNQNQRFGDALRSYLQVGWKWRERPQLFTYYQFYNLNYYYAAPDNKALIAIPERDRIHYLGAALEQQLFRKFYYQLGGSIGWNSAQNALLYFGNVNLEYLLLNDLRLRSNFIYGSQNSFIGRDNSKSLSLDLYYFY